MLAWMDLEMTGLDPSRHVIVEIATLLTDDDLNLVAEGPDLVVHQPPEALAEMDDVVVGMHTRSGLLPAIEASTITLEEAGAATLAFLQEHIDAPRSVPLCGNSIGTDRRFLAAFLPGDRGLPALPVGRRVDAQGADQAVEPAAARAAPRKAEGHRALDDIRESLKELRLLPGVVLPGGRRARDGRSDRERLTLESAVMGTHDHSAPPARVPKQEQEPASTEVTEVARGILRLQLPSDFTGLGHVNCYCIEDSRGVTLVDPGLPTDESWEALKARMADAGVPLARVHTVFITHSHPDHFGGRPQAGRGDPRRGPDLDLVPQAQRPDRPRRGAPRTARPGRRRRGGHPPRRHRQHRRGRARA